MAVPVIGEADWEAQVLKQDGWVLVDFFAIWCGPCRAMAPLLDRFAEMHPDVKVYKVDSDADEPLSERYMVRKIPTVIAFKNGEEVRRAINPQTRAALEELIAE
ncbi:MAG: thioredoxin [Armatimonadota bacterium]